MFLILDELKDMIKMQGGNADGIRDIGVAVMTLKRLMKQNAAKPVRPQQTFQPRHEDRRKEKRNESEEA